MMKTNISSAETVADQVAAQGFALVPNVFLMRPLAVHASSKSKSNQSRRVLHIEYAAERSFDGLELAFA